MEVCHETDNPICSNADRHCANRSHCNGCTCKRRRRFNRVSFWTSPDREKQEAGQTEVRSEQVAAKDTNGPDIAVYRSNAEAVEQMALEDYVMGVVASEMPADYEVEALKAQALAARTFAVAQMKNGDKNGDVPQGALVTDTVAHQVYQSKDELKEKWKDAFDSNWEKVETAVRDTSGEIMTYDGEPITASFFQQAMVLPKMPKIIGNKKCLT